MTESILHNRKRINNLLDNVDKSELKLSKREVTILDSLVKFLCLFHDLTKSLSSESGPTINKVLPTRILISNKLQDNENDCELIKRYPISDIVLLSSMLDPRFCRLDEIAHQLSARHETKSVFLERMCLKYCQCQPRTAILDNPPPKRTKYSDPLLEMVACNSIGEDVKDDLPEVMNEYLEFSSIRTLNNENLLQFWKGREKDFPLLSTIARMVLSIPATSTSVERLFSKLGLIVTSRRAQLKPINVDKLILLHDNYKTIVSDY
jgi:hypothetical protein